MNPNTLKLFLNILKCGFDSKDEEVVMWAIRTVNGLGKEINRLGLSEQLWQWFNEDDVSEVIFYLFDTHTGIADDVCPIF